MEWMYWLLIVIGVLSSSYQIIKLTGERDDLQDELDNIEHNIYFDMDDIGLLAILTAEIKEGVWEYTNEGETASTELLTFACEDFNEGTQIIVTEREEYGEEEAEEND